MDAMNAVDILLVEDNPQDAELTIRALKKQNWPTGSSRLRMGPKRLTSSYAGAGMRNETRKIRPRWCSWI